MIFNAIMCVWNEEDIIESTIKHAFAQGCSNVLIVDNSSTDKTVDVAIKAGAVLADSFESEYFNEYQKIAYLNTIVKKYNDSTDEEHIWWLYIDADEFPNIDCDLTIFDFIKQLDPSIRAVQGYFYNHIPTHSPYNVSGYHPADFMQLANKSNTYKIPLIRYDKGKQHFYSGVGAHNFDTCGETVNIASDILNIHHFNYRRQEDTFRRLKQLTQKSSNGISRIDWFDKIEQKHKRTSDAKSMYHNRYENAKSIYSENEYKILITDELQYAYNNIVRWYNPYNITITNDCSKYDYLLSTAVHYYFLGNFDLALCKYNELIEMTDDNKKQLLITINIALCLSFTDRQEALSLLKPILRCPDMLIRNYAEKQFKKIYANELLSKNDTKEIKSIIQSYYSHFDIKDYI